MKVAMYIKSISSCFLYFSWMFKEYFQIVSIFGMRQARDISLVHFGLYCDKGKIFLTFRYWSVQIISDGMG